MIEKILSVACLVATHMVVYFLGEAMERKKFRDFINFCKSEGAMHNMSLESQRVLNQLLDIIYKATLR